MTSQLKVCVPEWQGYGVDDSPAVGAQYLLDGVFSEHGLESIPIDDSKKLELENQILGWQVVCEHLDAYHELLEQRLPETVFTLGGTCGIEVAPVTYLNQKYDGDLAVLWFDAHGDLNTPESSPSGHFHGMPVRTMLGEGDSTVRDKMFSTVLEHQIFLIGARDLDPPEQTFIAEQNIPCLPSDVAPEQLFTAIRERGFQNVYIHFDLDVLDPKEFGEMIFQVDHGMSKGHALNVLKEITEHFNVVGSSLLEFVPKPEQDNQEFLCALADALIGSLK